MKDKEKRHKEENKLRKLRLLILGLSAVMMITACSQNGITNEPVLSQNQLNMSDNNERLKDNEKRNTFDSVIALYKDNELVKDNFMANPLENTVLLDTWVENYRQGKPCQVAILLDGMGFASGLFILEGNGSATYTITEYSSSIHAGESEQRPAQVMESSYVVKREYDYIFGADWPFGSERQSVILIHRATMTAYFDGEEWLGWKPDTDFPLAGITPREAEARAEEIAERSYRNFKTIGYAGGYYLREGSVASIPDIAKPFPYYKTVGAVNLDGNTYYVVYGYNDLEALNREEHSGSVTAVGLDGRLVFIQSMMGGEWIFVDDAQQETIAPE